MGTIYSSSTSLGLCLTSNERQQNIITQVGETVVSRCFVGCLGQPRKRCSNRCCCGLRNYASDVRPIDPLAADGESPSQTLAPGVVVFCTATYCVCVCVCFLPIHSGHQVRWTYQPGSHRRKVTQDFSSTFFLRCVPEFFSREGFSHPFPSSTVKSNFV